MSEGGGPDALAFFRDAETQRVLERASNAAGMPLSVHYVERNQEGPLVAGWGGCEACQFVNARGDGFKACRQSRATASGMALRQGRPLPFICHMGFACVAAPALEGENFVLTFGPYCPAEESRSLQGDVEAGWVALAEEEEDADELPFDLDDIHRAPSDVAPTVAEWTLEVLAERWRVSRQATITADTDETEEPRATVQKRRSHAYPEALPAADIAAAVAGGNLPLARDLLQGALEEAAAGKRAKASLRRARAVAVVVESIEALSRAGQDVNRCWERLPDFVTEARAIEDTIALLDAAIRVLQPAAKAPEKTPSQARTSYEALNEIVIGRLEEGVTLNEVAQVLGQTPSAITHRLQRHFGMSYSEYVGRLRVDKAKELLRRTQLSATEVARRVGVRDQSNFGKLFKRYEGMTPRAYRQRYGSK